MSEPFIAEVKIFAGNFAPRSYAFCNGQLMPISQNTALFSLVGTTYGGDGRTTFGVPNLQGRMPMHFGSGPGLTRRRIGEAGGVHQVTLNAAQMPSHGHTQAATSANATTGSPITPATPTTPTVQNALATSSAPAYAPATDLEPLADQLGASQPHDNLQPQLGLNFIIALQGFYPSRS